ncbi:STAS domain-containing protein [Rhizobium oryzicola]|uniref:STAS domain-containing protein n=1 Tax=Rhizobium oryzicola TaxID=1232668 RepID=A0ABT8SPQ1_9HYPH|nr:STAS domain-containing protein [Rhizobium oryzicola]MDO1580512.1 STAS domain-containing protein [Rhizobium oryzicola]
MRPTPFCLGVPLPSNTPVSLPLSLPGQLTIRTIAAIQEELLSALAGNGSIILDIPEDAQADLSFVQLIEAARIYAGTAGKQLSLKQPASGQVLEVLDRGGFLQDMAAEDQRFWLHERTVQ